MRAHSGPSTGPRAARARRQAPRTSGGGHVRFGADRIVRIVVAGEFAPGADGGGPFLPLQPVRRVGGDRAERGGGPGRGVAGGVLADPVRAGVHQRGDLGHVRAAFGVGEGGDLLRPRPGRERDQGAEPMPDAGVQDGGDVAGSSQVPFGNRPVQDSEAAAARSAHLVAFPFTHIDPGWSYAGCPRDMILARNDLAAAADRIRAVIDRHGAGHAPAHRRGAGVAAGGPGGPAARADVAAVVGGGERGVRRPAHPRPGQGGPDPSPAAPAEGHRRRGYWQDLAGAGARPPPGRRRRAGRPGLLFPRPGQVPATDDRPVAACARPAYVGLFHALPLAWGADPPPEEPDSAASSTYYEERLPAQMGELAAHLDKEEKFDAIIVDEAQDFGAAWWPPTLACLRDQETGGLYAFLDEAQRVFERYGEVPIPLPPIVLDENIRNTKQIAQVFGSLGAGQARYRGMDGPPVRFLQCSPDEAVHEADSQVDRLLGQGWQPGQIALLVTGKRHQVQMEMLDTTAGKATGTRSSSPRTCSTATSLALKGSSGQLWSLP